MPATSNDGYLEPEISVLFSSEVSNHAASCCFAFTIASQVDAQATVGLVLLNGINDINYRPASGISKCEPAGIYAYHLFGALQYGPSALQTGSAGHSIVDWIANWAELALVPGTCQSSASTRITRRSVQSWSIYWGSPPLILVRILPSLPLPPFFPPSSPVWLAPQ